MVLFIILTFMNGKGKLVQIFAIPAKFHVVVFQIIGHFQVKCEERVSKVILVNLCLFGV